MSTQRYGWNPDRPDLNDYLLAELPATNVPRLVDLRAQCPPVYDQAQLGSCTANAIAGALEFDMLKQQEQAFIPSRLFIYFNERAREGTINEDAGAAIRDGIKSVAKQGCCDELEWPYDISRFTAHPPTQCYADALRFRALSYQRLRVHALQQMKACLATGYPFVFGFLVYSSFESNEVASSGVMPMPQSGEQLLGGHAVMAVGYDDARQALICRNSWGASFGDKGYFYMPYQYLLTPKLTDDFWVVRSTS